ncbi:MAG: LysM peptidoglycan-binding domain-containing protein [Halopseudomonas aestusnigri]
MNRTFAIALLIVFAISGAAVTVWYVNDDLDDSAIVSESRSNTEINTSAPKKIIKTLTGEPIAEETISLTTKEVSSPSSSTQATEDTSAEEITEANPEPNNTLTVKAEIDPSLSFDVIRVEKSGDTVLAGRAPAGSNVRIVDGTTILGNIEADANGQWVYVLETPLEPGAHELGLQVNREDGSTIRSKDVAIVDVAKGEETALAVLIPDEGPGVKTSVSKIIQLPVKVGENGIRDGDLALDSVDYDDDGQTVIGGTSQPGQKVVGYLNNEFVGQGVADSEGRWVVEPEKNVDEGLHQLRIDQIDDGGKVIARVEIPFSRSGKIEVLPDERIVTVQPGNSLWRISRAIYGQGGRYAVIYERNEDQIRNPDLIYPGQIFVLPKTN